MTAFGDESHDDPARRSHDGEVAGRGGPSLDGPVLVGTDDDSEGAVDALALGRMLADAIGSVLWSVYVHHVEDVGGLRSGGPATQALELVDQVAAGKDRRAGRLAAAFKARALPMVTASTVAAGLDQIATARRVALVVLGSSKSSQSWERPGISTAERLIFRQAFAVATAPANRNRRVHALEVVGCIVDGSPRGHRVLEWVIELTRRADARAEVLAAPPDRRRLADWVHDLERSRCFDLLVTGSRSSGGLRTALLGDTATTLMRISPWPTVVVPTAGNAERQTSDGHW
jgi:nucleotide-binding universal stress UspA family protein